MEQGAHLCLGSLVLLQSLQAPDWPTYISLLGAAKCPGQSHSTLGWEVQALGQLLPPGQRLCTAPHSALGRLQVLSACC